MAFVLLLAYTLANMMPIHATDDIHPAKIFMKQVSTVGGEVEVICSTYGFRTDPSESVFIYLCKNGTGIRRQLEDKSFETKIILKNLVKDNTGKYSCVFSLSEYEPSEVRRKGDNSVFFRVIDDFIPANIALRDESVREGDDVVLRCTLQDVQMLHSRTSFAYLSKDGVPVQLQTWDTEKNEAKFTIKSITKENNGNYSCVLFKSGLLTSTTKKLYGNNTVLFSACAAFSGDFIPANIAVRHESVREGDDVVLRCTLQDVQMLHSSTSFAYLSKDGVPVQLQTWDTEKNEAKFTIKSITKENKGNYSCVLFKSGLLTSTAKKLYGNNTVLLSARAAFSGDFIPANIALRDESVREGDDVVLRCTLQDVQMLHSRTSFAYLSKDGVPVQLQTWDTEKNEAKFTIKSITKENNGNYSCVLFKSGLLTSTTKKLYGNNTVLLSAHATFSKSILAIRYLGFVILLAILVMMVGVWQYRVTKKGKSKGGPEREQEEENRNSTELQHSVPVPEDNTFQETGCHTYQSAEFSDEDETSFSDENWIYHGIQVEMEPPLPPPPCSAAQNNNMN